MLHCWRWFGPHDDISLQEVAQTGTRLVVSALHEKETGEAWTREEIQNRKGMIGEAGLEWRVVESIPVHEDIKLGRESAAGAVDNFCATLEALGREGIGTVCYNFMPALDWSRTQLMHSTGDGSVLTSFNHVHFACVDMFILRRPSAEKNYDRETREAAKTYFDHLSQEEYGRLEHTFLLGFPGSNLSLDMDEVRERIAAYEGMDASTYRSHLAAFLEKIVPVASESGVRLAIHPDDPPWSLMGMPRIYSSMEDARYITGVVDSPHNGLTLCSGSLGALFSNRVGRMSERLATRINFAHLRNVRRDEGLNFQETHLLEGDVDIPRIMLALVREEERRLKQEGQEAGIPVRPDHGAMILGDHERSTYPGYSLYGRMKSMAELRGMESGIRSMLDVHN